MPSEPKKCEFDLPSDKISFTTRTNGDHIRIDKVNLGAEASSNLAWLISVDGILKVEIKAKEV